MTTPQITISVSFDKKVKKSDLFTLRNSKECADMLRNIFSSDTFDWVEEMILLCVNSQLKVLGYYKVSSGGTTSTICDPKVIFTTALNCPGTTGIILSHNHPSGALYPSQADIALTDKIKKAGEIIGIDLLDHIIVTGEGYYSLCDNGNM